MRPTISAVVVSWNKREALRKNLISLMKQQYPFDEIIVVDNASEDDTIEMIKTEFPMVKFIVMYENIGATKAFNIGFATAQSEYVAVLDDDVELPSNWVKNILKKFEEEPESTSIVSTKVIEPNTPQSFIHSKAVNAERYMATFRGCGFVIKRHILQKVGYYDSEFFLYGNERDMACRILNQGYRIKQYPKVITYHNTPFGVKGSSISLYYHTRNFMWYLFKNCSVLDIFRMQIFILKKLCFGDKRGEEIVNATGTIGIFKNIKRTKGAHLILLKALIDGLLGLPYCLKHRQVCKSPDFELPVK